jgi:quercetin dioxygenase-like cupin family protein
MKTTRETDTMQICETGRIRHHFLSLTAVLALAALQSATAAGETLLQTGTTWEGGRIIYPEGEAEVTSVILRIEPGSTPPFHCHPVPTMGYVLKGAVEVETSQGRKAVFRAGESVVEVLGTMHRGRALEGPVEIVVFYAGAKGVPTTVRPEDGTDGHYCKD